MDTRKESRVDFQVECLEVLLTETVRNGAICTCVNAMLKVELAEKTAKGFVQSLVPVLVT